MKRGLLAIGFLLVVAAVLPLSSSARSAGGTTITVNTLGDSMSVDGLCTLREAIDNANANKQKNTDCAAGKGDDKIVFSVGGTINLTGELPAVQDLLTIDGGNNITINGGDSFRIVTVTAKNATLMNMVLTHGAASDGGAIQSLGKTLRVDGLELSFNQASSTGGAIASESSTLDVRNSNFHDNLAGGGGAIFAFGSLTVQDTHINENGAEEGGGILAFSLRMERSEVVANGAGLVGGVGAFFDASITDTLIQANIGDYPPVLVGAFFVSPIAGHAPVTPKFIPHPPIPEFGKATFKRDFIVGNAGSCFGGGIGTAFVQLTILESTIAENTVSDSFCGDGFGGGVAAEFTFGTIANSTISGNSADSDGGGIAIGEAFPVNVINSTIVDNQVDGSTGAGGIVLGGGQVYLTNTIVSGNDGGGDDSDCGLLTFAPNPGDGFFSGGNNIDGDDTCNLTMPKDMPNTDPDLLPLFDWGGPTPTMPPDDGSPAVGAGGTPACKASPVSKHDQRGVARPQGTQCDIGAVERVGDEEL